MNFIIYHFISGTAFFSGTGIVILACLLFFVKKMRLLKIICRFAVLIGFAVMIFSATPLLKVYYFIWSISVCCCVMMETFSAYFKPKRRITFRILAILLSLGAMLLEIPYHMKSQLPDSNYQSLYVIGDSISAGIGDRDEIVWPVMLQDTYGIDVYNAARAGATARSAKKQLSQVHPDNSLIILEIGGNDLLHHSSSDQFETDLKELLSSIDQTNGSLLMFELPLPPFYNHYGAAQRSLAKSYEVTLIPKRYFADILNRRGATVDGIHLSQTGHNMMANMIWQLISQNFTDQTNE